MLKLKEQISNLDREVLEEKFLNQIIFKNGLNQPKEEIDFTNSMIKRRFQYLNKTYTEKSRIYNALLLEYIEEKDNSLKIFLNSLYKKLEEKAKENNDLPLNNYPLNK